MNKIKNFLNKNRNYVIGGIATTSLIVPQLAFAEGGVSTTVSSSLQTITTDVLATVAAVAPIGLTIFGAMFAWRKGVQFFKSVTK